MAENGLLRLDVPPIGPENDLITWADAGIWHKQNLRDAWRAMQDPQTWMDAATQWAGSFEGGTKLAGRAARAIPGLMDRISTRVPTAVRQAVDPHTTSDLVINLDAARASGDAYPKNAALIAGYRDVPTGGLEADPEGLHQALVAHAGDNLRYLHDAIPAPIREQSKRWYDGANAIARQFAEQFGISVRQAAGVIASLSPQKDWFQNVDLARRILEIRATQGNTAATPEMSPWFEKIIAGQKNPDAALALRASVEGFRGKPLSEITDPRDQALWLRAFDEAHNPRSYRLVSPEGEMGGLVVNLDGSPRGVGWGSIPEIAKATGVLGEDSLLNISRLMGGNHKVRNFYNNIVSPNAPTGDVTIDTHAIAAAHMRPLAGTDPEVKVGLGLAGSANNATGSRGLYGAYADAYRLVAQDLGLLPRELQSITWEGIRGLYPDVLKRNRVSKAGIDDIWTAYGRGEISAADARDASVRAGGGIDPPEWWRPGP